MRAYHLDRLGDLDGLISREHEVPTAGPHEVLVRIRATSLNRRDMLIINETYPVSPIEGVTPLSDGAGEIVAVGEGVSRVSVGDRVCSTYLPGWIDGPLRIEDTVRQLGCNTDGLLAEYRVLHEDWVIRIPDQLSFAEAATLPCAALTAWTSLRGRHPVQPGDTVLTLGTGGVALFAVQLAVAMGARVIAATTSAHKAQALEDLGAAHVLTYDPTSDWHKQVRDVTADRGVDRVVETIGPPTLEQSIRSLAFGGEIAMVGVFGGHIGSIGQDSSDAPMLDARLFAGHLYTVRSIPVGSRTGLDEVARFIAEHDRHPVIDSVYDFADAREAFRHFDSSNHIGKVVITC